MMIWFDRLYPALMVVMPAMILRCVKVQDSVDREAAAAKARRVYRLTALALILHVLAMVLFETLQQGRSPARTGWVVGYSMFAFFQLWFGFAVPALAARHPGWGNAHRAAGQRSASLKPRQMASSSSLPGAAWALGWLLYAGLLGATFWGLARGLHASLTVGLIWWPGFAWGARAVRTEAEPRDAGGAAQLESAYWELRRFRSWCFFVLGVLGTVGLATSIVVIVLGLTDVGWLGAVGGMVLGLLGAVAGTVASFRRARINGLLQDLDRDLGDELDPQGHGNAA